LEVLDKKADDIYKVLFGRDRYLWVAFYDWGMVGEVSRGVGFGFVSWIDNLASKTYKLHKGHFLSKTQYQRQ
jgi:hypothetical protein